MLVYVDSVMDRQGFLMLLKASDGVNYVELVLRCSAYQQELKANQCHVLGWPAQTFLAVLMHCLAVMPGYGNLSS